MLRFTPESAESAIDLAMAEIEKLERTTPSESM
jgi:hypothetical protein